MKIIDISKDITSCPIYPGDPGVSIRQASSLDRGDSCNLTEITTGLHNGTHADAPLHFISNGDSITDAELGNFIGFCRVIETKEGALDEEYVKTMFPDNEKRVIIKGHGKSYITGDGAKAAAEKGLILIGTDSLSVGIHGDQTAPHREFLTRKIAIVENLDLENADEGRYFLVAQPLKIGGAEASILRALLIDDINEYISDDR